MPVALTFDRLHRQATEGEKTETLSRRKGNGGRFGGFSHYRECH